MFRGCPFGPVTEPAWPKKKREGFAAATTDAARRFFYALFIYQPPLGSAWRILFLFTTTARAAEAVAVAEAETAAAAAVATTMPAYQADNHTHTHKCMCMCMCIAHRPTFARCACKKEKNRHKWQLVRTTFLRRSFFGPFFALAARTTTHSLTGQ